MGSPKLRIGAERSYTIDSSYDASMEIVDGTLTPTSATICIHNNTDMAMQSENVHDFMIEVQNEGKWKEIAIERVNTANLKSDRIDLNKLAGPNE